VQFVSLKKAPGIKESLHATETVSTTRAPAGRCQGVYLHPSGFWYSVLQFHAQSLTQRRRQFLFYKVKYDSRRWCSTRQV